VNRYATLVEPKYSDKILSQCHCVHHNIHTD